MALWWRGGAVSRNSPQELFVIRLSYLIVLVWVISFTIDIFDRAYEPSPTIHALMLMLAGAFYGSSVFTRRNDGNDSTKSDDDEVKS